jgi:hypothetical protein
MKQKPTETGVWNSIQKLNLSKVVVVIILSLSLLTTGIAAQGIEGTFTDDFEDQSVNQWTGYDEYPQIKAESVEGSYSAYGKSKPGGGASTSIEWSNGPILDTTQNFTVTATFKHNYIDSTDNEVRIGLTGNDPTEPGNNAFILFDKQTGVTYLGTYDQEPTPSSSNRIENAYENTWLNIKINSDGNGTLQAKVWEYGTTEPSSYQLQKSFSGTSGSFGFNLGTTTSTNPVEREAWLDSVTIEGTAVEGSVDPFGTDITLDTRSLVLPGNTHPYTVTNDLGEDITDSATVTSNNSSVLSVDQTDNTITAVNDSNVTQVVRVEATRNDLEGGKFVVVGEPTVENLEIMPTFLTRTWALLDDPTIFALLIVGIVSVAASRFAGSFAGLGAAQMLVVIGWLSGYIGIGIAMLSVFTAIFIGLNLAENTSIVAGGSIR